MAQPQFAEKIRPGMSIAVTAGSRGIRNVDIITKAVVDFVKQKAHLLLLYRQWEVTEELRQRGRLRFWKASESQKNNGMSYPFFYGGCGAGLFQSGTQSCYRQNAYESDGIIVSCRLKPHNAFRGTHESGPCK